MCQPPTSDGRHPLDIGPGNPRYQLIFTEFYRDLPERFRLRDLTPEDFKMEYEGSWNPDQSLPQGVKHHE